MAQFNADGTFNRSSDSEIARARARWQAQKQRDAALVEQNYQQMMDNQYEQNGVSNKPRKKKRTKEEKQAAEEALYQSYVGSSAPQYVAPTPQPTYEQPSAPQQTYEEPPNDMPVVSYPQQGYHDPVPAYQPHGWVDPNARWTPPQQEMQSTPYNVGDVYSAMEQSQAADDEYQNSFWGTARRVGNDIINWKPFG